MHMTLELTTDDRIAIHEPISLHGHVIDDGAMYRLPGIFAEDGVYDVSDFGRGELHGVEAVAEAALDLCAGNPLGHHVTNSVIIEIRERDVVTLSKDLGVRADGTCGTVAYEDVVVPGPAGWRIALRRVRRRRQPLER